MNRMLKLTIYIYFFFVFISSNKGGGGYTDLYEGESIYTNIINIRGKDDSWCHTVYLGFNSRSYQADTVQSDKQQM